jgi:hypothetical protein
VTNAGGCSGTATYTVTPHTPPTPTITPSGATSICAGSSVTLDAGAGYTTYSWTPAANTQTVVANTTGIYVVTVTDAFGCTAVTSQSVTVNPLPTPTITGLTQICTGTTTTLDAGAGYAAYNWNNSIGTQTITVGTQGTYTVTVTTAAGCTASATTTVTAVANLTPTITGPTAFCAGTSVTLDAGAGYATYAWSPAGNSQTIIANAGATYTVTVTNAAGCSGTATHLLTQNPNPTAVIHLQDPRPCVLGKL